MINLVKTRKWFFLISAILIVPGLVVLGLFGLKLGIDYSAGSAITFHFEQPVQIADLREEMTVLGYPEAVIQDAGNGDFFVRMKEITPEENQSLLNGLQAALSANITEPSLYTVSPVIAQGTIRDTGIAIIITIIGILLYLAWAFRRMPKPLRWGTCAVVALAHDVAIVIVLFAILGRIAGVEADASFMTGLLAVVGISVNNIVVVFDRIRANLRRGAGSFELAVNAGINESIVRSLNTGLATFFIILAIYLFGGATVRNLVLVMLVGILTGIYSSICIAGQLLVTWQKLGFGKASPAK